jgi:leader peptidase (prepilin peptidase) / N-methyltransferase
MIEAVIALIFGLLIGSFLNVCIYRWPRDLSVVRPRSHCTSCEKMIAWYDNVPLLSFVILGGKCRHCGARISWRYPVVELATAGLFFYWVLAHGLTAFAVKMCVFSAILVALLFCDLEERILPDQFTLGGLLLGLILAAFVSTPDLAEGFLVAMRIRLSPALLSVAGAALSAGLPAFFLWGAGWLYEKVRHREGLGFGDVKLVALVGAYLGLENSLMTLVVGSIAGSVIGLAYIKLTGKDASTYELPFGTFLCAAALVVAVVGVTP